MYGTYFIVDHWKGLKPLDKSAAVTRHPSISVNEKTVLGSTPLMVATKYARKQALEVLIRDKVSHLQYAAFFIAHLPATCRRHRVMPNIPVLGRV